MTRWVALIAIMGLVLAGGVAGADVYGTLNHDWSGAQFHPDPIGDHDDEGTGNDGRDISGMWWDRDATYDYFRLDLAGTPTDTSADWAEVYGIYLDGTAGGAPATDSYVPPELDGIDWIVDMHPDVAGVPAGDPIGINEVHFHSWTGAFWTTVDLAPSEYLMRIGEAGSPQNSLQWRIPTADLSDFYYYTGATHDLGSGVGASTYDLTETEAVPEPATMALLGLGLAGLAAYRRRRA